MKIISWNVNGVRACVNKGFLEFLSSESPDICCIQETKAIVSDIPDYVAIPYGYHSVWHSAQKRGYSGVAVFSKSRPEAAYEGIGIDRYDSEGRVIRVDYPEFILFNVYFPNGQMSEERLHYKLAFYQDFFAYCSELQATGKSLIITGDFNTAHKPIDLANPEKNAHYSGFLPIEREWMDRIIEMGYVDAFRAFHPDPHHYTWWTYRFGARKRNIGWRIDYFMVTKSFMPRVTDVCHLTDITGSDHCPIRLTLS